MSTSTLEQSDLQEMADAGLISYSVADDGDIPAAMQIPTVADIIAASVGDTLPTTEHDTGSLFTLVTGGVGRVYINDGTEAVPVWRDLDEIGNAIIVAPTGGQYTTIEDGLAAAGAVATLTKRMAVVVYPGNYIENNPLILPDYVSLLATSRSAATLVYCNDPNAHGVVVGSHTTMLGLKIFDASGAGSAAYHIPVGTENVEFMDCEWEDCDIGYLCEAASPDPLVVNYAANFHAGTSTTGFKCAGGGRLFVSGFTCNNTTITNIFHSTGANSTIIVNGGVAREATITRVALVENTGILEVQNFHADAATEGFVGESTGATLQLGACQLTNVAGDHLRLGDDPSVSCYLTGCYLDDDKFNLGASALFQGYYQAAGARPGFTVIGELWAGVEPSEQLPVVSYLRATASSGWSSGGVVTDGGGLNLDYTAGTGVINTGTGVISIAWTGGTIAATDDSDFWLYVDNAGVIHQGAAACCLETNIILAIGRAEGGNIALLADQRVELNHIHSKRHEYILSVIGPIWISGLLTTLPGLLALDVSSGTFYFNDVLKTATGAAPITFTTWYNDGAWQSTPGVTNVPNTQYNSFGVGLVAIPAGEWVQHALYVAVSATTTAYHLVYAQATYAAQNLAELAALPNPPSIFEAGAMSIGGPVVQLSAATVASVIDQRPYIQTGTPGTALAATDHGALAGLGDDDHTRYMDLAGNALRNPLTGTFDAAGGSLIVPTAAAPAQTVEGSMIWDSNDDLLTVGDGASRKTLVDTTTTQILAGKTLTTPTIADLTNATHDHSNAAGGGSIAQSTEVLRGVAELATQAETDTGTNDTNIVTPLKLATYPKMANIAPDCHVITAVGPDVFNATVQTLIPGMTYTPPAGTWLVNFLAEIYANGTLITSTQLYVDGTPQVPLIRRNRVNNQYGLMSVHTKVTTTGVEVVEVRSLVSTASIDINGRTVSFTRVTSI